MSSFSSTLLSGFNSGWGMADDMQRQRENQRRYELETATDQQRYAQQQQRHDQREAIDQQRYDNSQAQQAWENEQQLSVQREAAALRRQMVEEKLAQKTHDRSMWAKINAPDPQPKPGIATGEGQGQYTAEVDPHPRDTVTLDDMAAASPEVQRAWVTAKTNQAQHQQAQQEAEALLRMAYVKNNWKSMFFVKDGKNSVALQKVIDAGKIGELPMDKIHTSATQNELDPDSLAEYLSNGDPQAFERWRSMPLPFLQKAAESSFTAQMLQPAYANPNDPMSQATLAANKAPFPKQGKGAPGAANPGATQIGAGGRTALAAMFGAKAREMYGKDAASSSVSEEDAPKYRRLLQAQAAALAGHVFSNGAVVLNGGAPDESGWVTIVRPDGSSQSVTPEYFRQMIDREAEAPIGPPASEATDGDSLQGIADWAAEQVGG